MFNFEFDEKRFEIIKEQLLRALKNFKAEQPYQHAVYYLALLLTEHAWTKQELIDAVARKFQDLQVSFNAGKLKRNHNLFQLPRSNGYSSI